jgi:hypothetical protein
MRQEERASKGIAPNGCPYFPLDIVIFIDGYKKHLKREGEVLAVYFQFVQAPREQWLNKDDWHVGKYH